MNPARMNLVEIGLRPLARDATAWDEDFREPLTAKATAAEVTLRGQVNLGSKQFHGRDRTATGDREPSAGHLVFRKADLDAAGVRPGKGDRVVRIAGEAVDFVITEVRPESPLRGEFRLVYAEFTHDVEERESV
jgi:hypothetical protein